MFTMVNGIYGPDVDLESWEGFVELCRDMDLDVPIRCQRWDRTIETLDSARNWRRTLVPAESMIAQRIVEARAKLKSLAREFENLADRAHRSGRPKAAMQLRRAADELFSVHQATERCVNEPAK